MALRAKGSEMLRSGIILVGIGVAAAAMAQQGSPMPGPGAAGAPSVEQVQADCNVGQGRLALELGNAQHELIAAKAEIVSLRKQVADLTAKPSPAAK